jgi:hypothetical protein
MATHLVPRPTSCTLYELEDNLQALVNSIDLAEEPSARETILGEIGQALRKATEKRDAVVAFLRHREMQRKFADAEVERIQKRKASIGRVQEELETLVVRVVERYATPDRRGVQRLEGNFSTLRIHKNPDSVLITDAGAIPVAFNRRSWRCRLMFGKRCCRVSGFRSGRSGRRAWTSLSSSQTRKRLAPSSRTAPRYPA